MFHHALWNLAFRPWFLIAGISAVVGMGAWLGFLNGYVTLGNALPPGLWHGEMMVFGMFVSVLTGFLFTAVQTWTGLRSLHGIYLALMTASWLGIRAMIWVNKSALLPFILAGLAAWWLLMIGLFLSFLLRSGNHRNLPIVVILSLIGSFQCLLFYQVYSGDVLHAHHALHLAILVFAVLSMLIGGRVIPMFTRNGLARINIHRPEVYARFWLERGVVATSLLALALYASLPVFQWSKTAGLVLVLLGVLNLYRWLRWFSISVLRVPLLWSLHLAYAGIASGLIGIGLGLLLDSRLSIEALHGLAIGGLALLMLSMMTRVSLGHTGRPLQTSPFIPWTYALIAAAALVRIFVFVIADWHQMITLSGLLWMTAFTGFLQQYWLILTRPRLSQ